MLLNIKDFFINKVVKVVEKKNKDLLSQSIINLLPKFILEIIAVTIIASVLSYFILNNYSFESMISMVTLITLIILRLVPAFSNINIAKTNLKHFENFSKDEIYDHRKAKFLQIGRDRGFSKSTNLSETGLSYKGSKLQKIKSHLGKTKLVYAGIGLLVISTLIALLF